MLNGSSRHSKSGGYPSSLDSFWHEHALSIPVLSLFILDQPIIHPSWFFLRLDYLLLLVFALHLFIILLISHSISIVIIIFVEERHHRAKSCNVGVRLLHLARNLYNVSNCSTIYCVYG